MEDAFNSLKEQQVPCCAYYEPDFGDAITSVATRALTGKERAPLRRFPLLR